MLTRNLEKLRISYSTWSLSCSQTKHYFCRPIIISGLSLDQIIIQYMLDFQIKISSIRDFFLIYYKQLDYRITGLMEATIIILSNVMIW